MVTNDMTHSPVVHVDNSNGRGCVLVGNEDQSTQATQFANNNNAKNNVIENCNSSSSSSSHHHPSNKDNNNNKNNDTSIGSLSSSANNYFSASQESQCQHFNDCNNQYSIASFSNKHKQDTGCVDSRLPPRVRSFIFLR